MSTGNMKLATVEVVLGEEDIQPEQRLEEGEFIELIGAYRWRSCMRGYWRTRLRGRKWIQGFGILLLDCTWPSCYNSTQFLGWKGMEHLIIELYWLFLPQL